MVKLAQVIQEIKKEDSSLSKIKTKRILCKGVELDPDYPLIDLVQDSDEIVIETESAKMSVQILLTSPQLKLNMMCSGNQKLSEIYQEIKQSEKDAANISCGGFMYNGCKINPDMTLNQLGVKKGDSITIISDQAPFTSSYIKNDMNKGFNNFNNILIPNMFNFQPLISNPSAMNPLLQPDASGRIYGKFPNKNGDVYEGYILNGQPDGQGIYRYKSGAYYEGDFKNGKSEGKGKYVYPSGAYYIGEFLNDQFHGQGRYVYSDGIVYIGKYKNDKKHGQGILMDKNGKVLQDGIWENGEFKG